MQVALLRVGIDAGSGGMQGPLFDDGTFELVPIPDGFRVDPRTYANTVGRHGSPFIDYFPASRRTRMASQAMHYDPEFETFTYGDPTTPKTGLRRLQPGDLLVFYAGLEGWKFVSPPALYLVGYFEVSVAGLAVEFTDDDLQSLYADNFHVRHPAIFEDQRPRLVLVKGGPSSRLLKRAVLISGVGEDRRGRPLKVLSGAMQGIFGDFGGKISIQRSPPRWVSPAFVDQAAKFVRSLD